MAAERAAAQQRLSSNTANSERLERALVFVCELFVHAQVIHRGSGDITRRELNQDLFKYIIVDDEAIAGSDLSDRKGPNPRMELLPRANH